MQVLGDERLTNGLLDRLTFRCHILEFLGDSPSVFTTAWSHRLLGNISRKAEANMTHKTATVSETKRYDKADPYYALTLDYAQPHARFILIRRNGLPGWRRPKMTLSPTPCTIMSKAISMAS